MADVAPAPLPAPSGTPSPGSAELADDLLKGLTPSAPPAPEPAPTPSPAPTDKVTDKPTAQPIAPAPDKDKPAPKPTGQPTTKDLDPDDQKVTAADLRKELKRIKEGGVTSLREKETQIAQLREQISLFEKRRFWTDQDLQTSEAATKRLAELESQLYARDYAESPEYKTKYQTRFDEIWKEASEEVQGLTIKYQSGTEEGEDGKQKPVYSERPATVKDLLAVVDAPARDRLPIATKLFGENKEAVLGWARDLSQIRKEAQRAIEDKRTGYTAELQKRQQDFAQGQQKMSGFIQQTNDHLAKTYPHIFQATADQPEAGEALRKGFAFVDESSAKMMEFDINTRAARASVIRAMAGAFPRLVLDVTRMTAENKELREKLAKFESTDPSEMGGGGGGAPAGGGGTKDGGSDDLAAEIEKLNKK
jgi:hypothetical protein